LKVRYRGDRELPALVRQGESSLAVDREYVVFQIHARSGGDSYFRIETIPGEPPGLFNVRMFEITFPELPGGWAARLSEDASVTVGPPEWNISGFWESYLDRDESAVISYEIWRSRMLE
jgi:hypothetical protein